MFELLYFFPQMDRITEEQVDVLVDIIWKSDWLSLETKRVYVEKVFN